MSYKWLKRLILWIPTFVIGLWEYVRHAFLLPYISMDLGNALAPVLVFLVTLTLLRSLFGKLEALQESLKRQQAAKAAFEEREQLARELHDGISQSLFMLSVKLDKLDRAASEEEAGRTMSEIRRTVRHVHEDVRGAIANLKTEPLDVDKYWLQGMLGWIAELERSSGITADVDWRLSDGLLTAKQKVELQAIIREALMNVQKHAKARHVRLEAGPAERDGSFRCVVADDGTGIDEAKLEAPGKYGVKMMRDRAKAMGWTLIVEPGDRGGTKVVIEGGAAQ
jgi:Signal transduction histidine kinase, nitrate/nitrite-specific